MKSKYLIPNKYKKIGWIVLIPSAVIGLITFYSEYQPDILDFNLPALFIDSGDFPVSKDKSKLFGMVQNNILNEIVGVLLIISSLVVAFSKEKLEDEYIANIRLDSLVWAVYVNYGILLLSFIFVFDFSFFRVMVFNMFTLLFFFIIRFNWQISKLKKSVTYAE